MRLKIIDGLYTICKLDKTNSIPDWCLKRNEFVSITFTEDELSIVCLEKNVPNVIIQEKGWKLIKVIGPLDFSLIDIISSISKPLAEAGISIFAISTYGTDYFLVKEKNLKLQIRF